MKLFHHWKLAIAVFTGLAIAGAAVAQSSPEEAFPTTPDPFMGDYEGRWDDSEDVDPELAAQVFPLGRDRYQVRIVNKLDMRCPPLMDDEVTVEDGVLAFRARGLHGRIENGVFTGGQGRLKRFEMERVERLSPTLNAEAPEGAVVLFDGSDLAQWQDTEGWEITEDGAMMVVPTGSDILSRESYKDVTLHVEFRNSLMPMARGQQRSNSGVFLQDTYEVQVLDSYGLEGYYNECGALYKVAAPNVNATAPPLQWQTYDIQYRAPRFGEDGEVTENARITVYHNGVLIHNDLEMRWLTAWKEKDRLGPPPTEPGPIRLQAHSNYVQFRNVWLVEGTLENWPPAKR